MTQSTTAELRGHEYAYDHRCVRIVDGQVCYKGEDDPVHQPCQPEDKPARGYCSACGGPLSANERAQEFRVHIACIPAPSDD